MIAQELRQLKDTALHSRPVKIQGIQQAHIRKLTRTCDLLVLGNKIRAPEGAVIVLGSFGVTARGKNRRAGELGADLPVKCLDGKTRMFPKGATVEILT